MKRLFFLMLSVFAISVIASAQDIIIKDANAVMRQVSGEFSKVEVSGSVDLYLSQSNQCAIAVSASEPQYRDQIKTVVENGVLKIGLNNTGGKWNGSDRKYKAYVSLKQLTSIKSSGSSDVYISGTISGDALDGQFSGSSDFKGTVNYKKLMITLSGSSDMNIKGTASVVEVVASGASDFNGYGLVTDRCTVTASGASSIQITANKEFNASASGASDIYYKGTATPKNIHKSGSSDITRKD